MDEVGVIFSKKKCLLNVWEAIKGDVYMHFAVTKLILYLVEIYKQVVESLCTIL